MAFNQANYVVGMTTDLNGYPIPKISLEGRNYQEFTFWNNLAIRDVNLATSPTLSINTLAGNSNILIDNTTDQALTVNISIKNLQGRTVTVLSGLSVPASSQKLLTDVDIPVLRTPIYQIFATVQAGIAPTLGGLYMTFGAVQA